MTTQMMVDIHSPSCCPTMEGCHSLTFVIWKPTAYTQATQVMSTAIPRFCRPPMDTSTQAAHTTGTQSRYRKSPRIGFAKVQAHLASSRGVTSLTRILLLRQLWCEQSGRQKQAKF